MFNKIKQFGNSVRDRIQQTTIGQLPSAFRDTRKDIVQSFKEQVKPTGEVIGTFARSLPRAGVATGLTIADEGMRLAKVNPSKIDAMYKAKGPVEKFFLGNEPVRSIREQGPRTRKDVKDITGLDVGKTGGVALSIFGTASDAFIGGGTRKTAIKEIAKLRNVDDIFPVAKNILGDVPDDEVRRISETLSQLTDEKQIQDVLSSAARNVSQSSKIPRTLEEGVPLFTKSRDLQGGKIQEFLIENDPSKGKLLAEVGSDGMKVIDIEINKDLRKKGIAENIYDTLDTQSLELTGQHIRSSDLANLTDDAKALWQNLETKGKAELIDGQYYRYVDDQKNFNDSLERVNTKIEGDERLIGNAIETGFYNTKALGVNEDEARVLKDAYLDTKEIIESTFGRKITHEEVKELSKSANIATNKVLSREEQSRMLASMQKTKDLLVTSLKNGTINKELVDTFLAEKSWSMFSGRLLEARKIAAEGMSGQNQAVSRIIEKMIDATDDFNSLRKVLSDVDFENADEVAEAYRKVIKPNAESWIDLIRFNAMLSSPLTNIRNLASNIGTTLVTRPLLKAVSGGIDFAKSLVLGTPRTQFASEAIDYYKQLFNVKEIASGTQKMIKTIRGIDFIENPDVVNYSIPITKAGTKLRKVENVLRAPMQIMEAIDQMMLSMTQAAEKAGLERRVAKGINIPDVDVEAMNQARKNLFRGEFVDDKDGVVLNALGSMGNLVNKARNSDNKVLRTMASWTIPFLQFGTNALKRGIEYHPVFGWSTLYGAKNKNEQLAKIAIGSASTLLTGMLVSNDRITFKEPISKSERTKWKELGIQPYSVKIGDTWVSYKMLPPEMAFNFALNGAVAQALKDKKIDEPKAQVILSSIGKNLGFIADQSYLKNIADLTDNFKGDEDGLIRLTSNYAQQVIPFRGMMSWINRLVDNTQRLPEADQVKALEGLPTPVDKQLQYIMLQIPGLAQYVPPRLDSKGREIKDENSFINAFSPFAITKQSEEQVREMERLQRQKDQKNRTSSTSSRSKTNTKTTSSLDSLYK